jgi:hypothetical protein
VQVLRLDPLHPQLCIPQPVLRLLKAFACFVAYFNRDEHPYHLVLIVRHGRSIAQGRKRGKD